ncbi:MAG: hypothetical protein OEZ31_09480, partial [Nitrospirota bacterium]|nr:hypothetical protein [Nitrospirota bacterium]
NIISSFVIPPASPPIMRANGNSCSLDNRFAVLYIRVYNNSLIHKLLSPSLNRAQFHITSPAYDVATKGSNVPKGHIGSGFES